MNKKKMFRTLEAKEFIEKIIEQYMTEQEALDEQLRLIQERKNLTIKSKNMFIAILENFGDLDVFEED